MEKRASLELSRHRAGLSSAASQTGWALVKPRVLLHHLARSGQKKPAAIDRTVDHACRRFSAVASALLTKFSGAGGWFGATVRAQRRHARWLSSADFGPSGLMPQRRNSKK